MRVVFLGTGGFAVSAFDRLTRDARSGEIAGLVTAVDRPRGRGRRVIPSEIATLARERGVPVLRTADANEPDCVAWVRERRPDALAVVDFGQLLRERLLEAAPLGGVNLHPSLLPRHRGASPVPYTILSGDEVTGVCIIRMVRRMDAGAVLACVATPVGPGETAGDLADRLKPIGAELLAVTLAALPTGELAPEEQDDSLATYAPKLTAGDRRVDWSSPAPEIVRRIHAMSPRPGVSAHLVRREGSPVRCGLLRASAGDDAGAPAGVVGRIDDGALVVGAGEGSVAIRALKPAGKREQDAASFARGYRVEPGDRFESEPPA